MDSKTLSRISQLINEKAKTKKNRNKDNKKNNKTNSKKKQINNKRNVNISLTPKEKKSKKNKKPLKRLQSPSNFKLDNNTKLSNEKQVKKDLLHVKNLTNLKQSSKTNPSNLLRERLQNQLKSSRFRYLNEQLYTTEGKEAKKFFQSDLDSFSAYHEGFRQQVSKWPMNPVDKIIAAVRKMPTHQVIADFGCGEAKLARSVPHKVHSFDLVETVPGVIACDMTHSKLPAASIDVAVYCLSLMGINLHDYLAEANRVLKIGGIMKIAEVESRFDKIETFIQGLQNFGFKLIWKDLSHNLFYFLDFKKERNIKNKNKLPTISLHPCLYKRR